jgi:hypothetical protein
MYQYTIRFFLKVKNKMRLKVRHMFRGRGLATRFAPKRPDGARDKGIKAEVYDTHEHEPIRRATEKLKHLAIKKTKPLKKYISFG